MSSISPRFVRTPLIRHGRQRGELYNSEEPINLDTHIYTANLDFRVIVEMLTDLGIERRVAGYINGLINFDSISTCIYASGYAFFDLGSFWNKSYEEELRQWQLSCTALGTSVGDSPHLIEYFSNGDEKHLYFQVSKEEEPLMQSNKILAGLTASQVSRRAVLSLINPSGRADKAIVEQIGLISYDAVGSATEAKLDGKKGASILQNTLRDIDTDEVMGYSQIVVKRSDYDANELELRVRYCRDDGIAVFTDGLEFASFKELVTALKFIVSSKMLKPFIALIRKQLKI